MKLFTKTLKLAGYSVTDPRRYVFDLLQNQPPQSVADLMKRSQGKIDRASLYRTIKLFEKLNIIHRIHIGWKYKLELTERFLSHHHHIYCLMCGKIIDIKEPPQLKKYIDLIANKTNFQISSHTFELEGMCQKCHKNE